MKIGIDVSMLVYQGSGVATYTYNFVKSLLLYDRKNEYKLFYSSLRRPKNFIYLNILEKLGAKIYSYRMPPKLLKLCWNKFHILPIDLFLGDLDVFHSSDYLRPPLPRAAKSITTLHDLTWKKFPQFHTLDVVKAHENKLKKTVHYKDLIMVDSLQTYKDLLFYYPQLDKTKIYVNYPGVDGRFKEMKDTNLIKKTLGKYHLSYPKRYCLYVGAIEPRKNLPLAIQIYKDLITINKYQDFDFLIVGRAGWKNEDVYRVVKELNLGDKVRFVGYVADDDLVYFYNAAQVFIYLSKYEGFGLPPLEAAKCGVPSLVYRNSSLGEIFPADYPFAKEGRELEILLRLIETNYKPDQKYLEKFSWKSYCDKFLKIISKPRSLSLRGA